MDALVVGGTGVHANGMAHAAQDGYGELVDLGRAHLRVLPASANWYCSKVALANDGGDEPPTNATKGNSSARFFAHLKRGKKDQRVTALQFLKDTDGALRLLCGGEEGSLQVWDVASLTLVEQHRKHGVEVMAVAASSALDPTFVVAGDRQGRISTWKRDDLDVLQADQTNLCVLVWRRAKVAICTPIAGDGVFAMEMAPHDKALVAVGYRSGVLCIVDALQGNIRHRLDGHDQEVQSVVWKLPSAVRTSGNLEEDTSDDGVWLASSSRDRTIKVWKVLAEDEPILAKVLALPKGKQASSYNQAKRLWLPIAWSYGAQKSSQLRLWSGSFDGNLFQWEWTVQDTVSKTKSQVCKPTVFKNGHSRLLFNIVSLSPAVGVPESKLASAPSMMSVSLDRELRVWKEGSTSSPTLTCWDMLLGLGGHVYGLSYNAGNEIVAAGVGDQTIRLWNVSPKPAGKNPYHADLLWKGLQSKVTCIAWNPFQKSILAYGTEDGQIGLFDIESKRNTRFKSSHSSQVQDLQWRRRQLKPKRSNGSDKNAFVEAMLALENAQADGRSLEDALADQDGGTQRKGSESQISLWSQDRTSHILESDAEKADAASREVELVCSCFAWDPHCEYLAVGRGNGVVELLSSTGASSGGTVDAFESVQKFHEHEQRVTRLAWSPSRPSFLAAGSQDGKILVFNVHGTTEETSGLKKRAGFNEQIVGAFTGHNGAITSLRWSFHEDETSGSLTTLASSSNDGTVQVWHIESHTRLSCFRHHFGRVLTVDWIDHFVLASGGEDQSIRIWDYREQKETTDLVKPQLVVDKNGRSNQRIGTESSAETVHPRAGNEADGNQMKSALKTGGLDHQPHASKKATKAKKKKTKAAIFHPETRINLDESLRFCRHLISSNEKARAGQDEKPSKADHKLQAPSDYALEENEYEKEQDWEHLAQVYLLQGKIGEALRVVAKEGALNASWLAFAPMAGMDVWREATNVYAHQLDAQGDKKNAGKARAAAKCLASGNAYKEAIALIHSRLGRQDPLANEVTLQYASYLEKKQQFGEAARMYLSIGSASASSRAMYALVQTGDIGAFETALEILASLKQQSVDFGKACADLSGVPAEEAESSVPSSVFLDIIRRSLQSNNFALAEKASRFVGAGVASSSSLSMPNRLARCVLGVMNELNCRHPVFSKHVVRGDDGGRGGNAVAGISSWRTCAPRETQELFAHLMDQHKHRYDVQTLSSLEFHQQSESADAINLRNRAEQFWDNLFSLCRENGLWFGEIYETDVIEAQELLMDKNYFAYLLDPAPGAGDVIGAASSAPLTTIMGVSQCLLQFLLDAICGYLLSGLERMREVFELALAEQLPGSCGADRSDRSPAGFKFGVVSLFFPSGFIDPKAPPDMGELATEEQDTLVFWRSFLLHQWLAVVAVMESRQSGGDGAPSSTEMMHRELAVLLESGLQDEEELQVDSYNQKLQEDLRTAVHSLLNEENCVKNPESSYSEASEH